jgi:hypothetical protein
MDDIFYSGVTVCNKSTAILCLCFDLETNIDVFISHIKQFSLAKRVETLRDSLIV